MIKEDIMILLSAVFVFMAIIGTAALVGELQERACLVGHVGEELIKGVRMHHFVCDVPK